MTDVMKPLLVNTKVCGSLKTCCGRRKPHVVKDGESSSMGEVEKPISDSELLRIMECPVCNEFPAPPIFSCEKGHFTCNSCMILLDACSLCQAPFTDVRNFALESIIENSNFRCRNAHLGCAEVMKGSGLSYHVANCIFRPLDCKESDCLRQNLSPKEYCDHMIESHKVIGCEKKLIDGKAVVLLKQNKDCDAYHPCYVKIIIPDTKEYATFLVYSKRYRTFMCWWACCLQPERFSQFKVKISLDSPKGTEFETTAVQWTLSPQPVWKDFDEIRDTGRCAVLPDTHLKPFYIDEDNWQLKVEIIKNELPPRPYNFVQHYYPLLLLIIVGFLTVVFTMQFEDGWNWFCSVTSNNPNFTSGIICENDKVGQDSEEYIGYRGFYYKAR